MKEFTIPEEYIRNFDYTQFTDFDNLELMCEKSYQINIKKKCLDLLYKKLSQLEDVYNRMRDLDPMVNNVYEGLDPHSFANRDTEAQKIYYHLYINYAAKIAKEKIKEFSIEGIKKEITKDLLLENVDPLLINHITYIWYGRIVLPRVMKNDFTRFFVSFSNRFYYKYKQKIESDTIFKIFDCLSKCTNVVGETEGIILYKLGHLIDTNYEIDTEMDKIDEKIIWLKNLKIGDYDAFFDIMILICRRMQYQADNNKYHFSEEEEDDWNDKIVEGWIAE